ncbi:uncharacterized protein LOC123658915 [Melitaea cinxia]|uniref:uncharacterized protein LOC123658915 n=1 Tax=Melitaea cinxia TaxID=113334 RepID=UPI001E271356|nr:uncharacterized protein LOC123658915 [Melitaea cinxia]
MRRCSKLQILLLQHASIVLLPQPEGKACPTGQRPATVDTLHSNVPIVVHTSFGYIVAGRSSSAAINNKKANKIEGCRYNSTNGFLAYASSPCMPPVSEGWC